MLPEDVYRELDRQLDELDESLRRRYPGEVPATRLRGVVHTTWLRGVPVGGEPRGALLSRSGRS